MNEAFGSDSFFAGLKAAWDRNDREEMALLLDAHVKRVGGRLLQKSCFSHYTCQDREDALQDAMLYVLKNIDAFLRDPRNSPDSPEDTRYSEHEKNGWLRKVVFNGLRHSSQRILQNSHDSLDRTLGEAEDGFTLANVVPLRSKTMEDALECREMAEEALRRLFGLPNEPATLAAVGYMILVSEMEKVKIPLEGFADYFNKTPVSTLISQMRLLLVRHGLDGEVLLPLEERMRTDPGHAQEMTAKKLANRKSSILRELRLGKDGS